MQKQAELEIAFADKVSPCVCARVCVLYTRFEGAQSCELDSTKAHDSSRQLT